jgi:hypothetical protein
MHGRTWLGAVALVGLAAGVAALVPGSADPAEASTTVTFTRGQLVINQRISQAAVLRSNESLGLLSPIRRVASQPTKLLGWGTEHIRDGAVTGPKLADGSVSAAKLADGSVSAAKLADGSVSAAKLADGSVRAAKLAAGVAGAPTNASTLSIAGPVDVPADKGSLAQINLPAGSWLILAKAYAATEGPLRTVSCTLQAGADADTTLAATQKDSPASLALQVTHAFAGSPGAADLRCSAPAEGGLGTGLNAIKLTAIQTDTLTVVTPQP